MNVSGLFGSLNGTFLFPNGSRVDNKTADIMMMTPREVLEYQWTCKSTCEQ